MLILSPRSPGNVLVMLLVLVFTVILGVFSESTDFSIDIIPLIDVLKTRKSQLLMS